MSIFISSDTHLGHNKGFLYTPRGFTTIEEHDEAIITNWNNIITSEDTVYHLGDVTLGPLEHGIELFSRLNGNIKVILGNHDSNNRITEYEKLPNVEVIGYATIIKSGKWRFYLSHYPTKVGGDYNMKDNLWALCGHSHSADKFSDIALKSYHCELDAHDNKPVNLEDIKLDIIKYKEIFKNENY